MYKLTTLSLLACATALSGFAQNATGNDEYRLIKRITQADLNTIVPLIEGNEVVGTDESKSAYILAKASNGLKYILQGTSCNDDGCLGLMVQVRYTVDWPQNWEYLNTANYQRAAATTMREGDDILIVQRYLILDGGMTAKNIEYSVRNLVIIAPSALTLAKTGKLEDE